MSCDFISGATAVTNKLTRHKSEILADFNKCFKSMPNFNYFFSKNQIVAKNGFQTALLTMITNSSLQSSTRTHIHNAILFIDTLTMLDTSKLIH